MLNSTFFKKNIRPTFIKVYAWFLGIPFKLKHQWVKLKYGKKTKDLPVEVLQEEYKGFFEISDLTAVYIKLCGELEHIAKLCGRDVVDFQTTILISKSMNGHYLNEQEESWLTSILYAANTRKAIINVIYELDLSPTQLKFYSTNEFEQWLAEGKQLLTENVSIQV